ncbi:hypothetical protein CEUSTIGMA_g443.t1 [Chlamydomonas eustigma]|uniref:Inosine/uridine-preferring nucleoside hydrolase domain-containing protein n=1 Tax=Chlamydomonas eustigma TaxID=1157962 RepID=A0A250WQC1_9CHLO|nr:hypothetical protein CEUSTIGMA_g443.t1 [Chlamydomonas eustigma]|eukprot:GAX72991.1 hypothetical protein CEUSTIGMA_g443.t1 [Chlamydomonas eustigma]
MRREPAKLWLDCDPGHDDAMAIILAGHNRLVNLIGVSTVAGNQTVAKVTQNALDIVHAAGLPLIEVVAGLGKPLLRHSAILCPEIHGDSGLDGPEGGPLLPKSPLKANPGKAVLIMFEAIQEHYMQKPEGEKIRLVCIGPLSNAAILFTLYPEVIPMVEVVLMGGCLGVGNTGPVMEFNIQTDPEAAKVVFECGVKLTMIPLEVTHTVLATPEVLRAVAGISENDTRDETNGDLHSSQNMTPSADCAHIASRARTLFRKAMVHLLLFFAETYRTEFEFPHPPLHDPCAVAYVIAPEIFKVRDMRVDIEVCSEVSAGQTVCDRWNSSKRSPNCSVAMEVDVNSFWRLMQEAIAAADAVSPLNNLATL